MDGQKEKKSIDFGKVTVSQILKEGVLLLLLIQTQTSFYFYRSANPKVCWRILVVVLLLPNCELETNDQDDV